MQSENELAKNFLTVRQKSSIMRSMEPLDFSDDHDPVIDKVSELEERIEYLETERASSVDRLLKRLASIEGKIRELAPNVR